MRLLLASTLSFLVAGVPALATANPSQTTCLGPTQAKGHVIYLHGLTPPEQRTNEEGENLEVLERLARDLSLRIAVPRGPLCPSGKLCWPAADKDELLKTFASVRADAQACWTGTPDYSLLGFSNGGYFAFKLYKVHNDPLLTRIVAAGSAGTWDEKTDMPHPSSSFAMMIGQQDITMKKASQLAQQLRKSIPGFRFEKFPGAHRLDYKTLSRLLGPRKS